jgi:hypothetical protein
MAMFVTELLPWLPLASTLAFIMTIPLLADELPDYPDRRENMRG